MLLLVLGACALPGARAGDAPARGDGGHPQGDAAGGAARPPSAIVISIDSLRADHLPFHGYPRMTAPFLDGLVRQGKVTLFDRMTAVSPSCHPSHVAIITGLYPHQVGVPLCGEDLTVKHSDLAFEENVHSLEALQEDLKKRPEPFRKKKRSAIRNMMELPRGTQTLATFLGSRGYRTGGFVSIWTLAGRFGYERGFDTYADEMTEYYGPRSLAWLLRDHLGSQLRRDGAGTLEDALEFISSLGREERFFVFMNFADTHVPYGAPEEVTLRETPERRAEVREAWSRRYPEGGFRKAMDRMAGKDGHLLDEYDRSILYVDSLLRRLFGRLEELGRLEETAVIITSDHGDSFGQHRWLKPRKDQRPFFEHSVYVWEETQGVPLLVYDPTGRMAPGRREVNASQVDIVPTVLGLLGQDAGAFAAGDLPGGDLARMKEGPRTVFFMTFGRGRPGLLRRTATDYPRFLGFRSGDWKFFVDKDRLRNPEGGSCFLFDLSSDPHEMNNICGSDEHVGRAARFRATVVEWWNTSTSPRRPGDTEPRGTGSGGSGSSQDGARRAGDPDASPR